MPNLGNNSKSQMGALWAKFKKNLDSLGPPIKTVTEWKKVLKKIYYFC